VKFDLPEKASEESLNIDCREIEAMLQGPAMQLKPWPGAQVKLKDGRTLFIREARIEEAPKMLTYMEKIMHIDHDFYDIVGARVYSEILGWYRHRIKDPYQLVGLIDGQWAGFANGRLMNEDINISLHTMALQRGGRIGAVMYYASTFLSVAGCPTRAGRSQGLLCDQEVLGSIDQTVCPTDGRRRSRFQCARFCP